MKVQIQGGTTGEIIRGRTAKFTGELQIVEERPGNRLPARIIFAGTWECDYDGSSFSIIEFYDEDDQLWFPKDDTGNHDAHVMRRLETKVQSFLEDEYNDKARDERYSDFAADEELHRRRDEE